MSTQGIERLTNLDFGAVVEIKYRQIGTPSCNVFDAFRGDLRQGDARH